LIENSFIPLLLPPIYNPETTGLVSAAMTILPLYLLPPLCQQKGAVNRGSRRGSASEIPLGDGAYAQKKDARENIPQGVLDVLILLT
jgi:hypothetical protein